MFMLLIIRKSIQIFRIIKVVVNNNYRRVDLMFKNEEKD